MRNYTAEAERTLNCTPMDTAATLSSRISLLTCHGIQFLFLILLPLKKQRNGLAPLFWNVIWPYLQRTASYSISQPLTQCFTPSLFSHSLEPSPVSGSHRSIFRGQGALCGSMQLTEPAFFARVNVAQPLGDESFTSY
jgi:hypothetical protein